MSRDAAAASPIGVIEESTLLAPDFISSEATSQVELQFKLDHLPSRLLKYYQLLDNKVDADVERILAESKSQEELKAVFEPSLTDLRNLWEEIFDGCSTKVAKSIANHKEKLSISSMKENGLITVDLTYGAVEFKSLAWLFINYIPLNSDMKTFYDLGSGTGRGIFAAALLHDFTKLRGVEIIPGLHQCARRQLTHYEHDILPSLQANEQPNQITSLLSNISTLFSGASGDENKQKQRNNSNPPSSANSADILSEVIGKGSYQDIIFECQDFRKIDWSDADVVWANSTCFSAQLLKALAVPQNNSKKPPS